MALFGAGARQPAIAWTIPIGAALGIGLGLACNVDPGQSGQFAPHCADDNGDATCRQSHPNKPFCSLCAPLEKDQGCVSTAPVPACRADPVATSGNADDGTTGGGGSGDGGGDSGSTDGTSAAVDESDSGGSSTGVVGTPCDQEGELDEACQTADPAQPYCSSGVCSTCVVAGGDPFCGGLDSAAPACDAAGGTCVACFDVGRPVCDGATPICDETGGSCLPCTEHDQCESGACHLSALDPAAGSCFSPDSVIWVDQGAICPGTGTEASPICDLTAALDTVGDGEEAVIMLQGGTPYEDDVILGQSATIAVIGTGTPLFPSAPGPNEPTFQLSGDVLLYVSRIRITGNENRGGVQCDGATLVASDSEIATNLGWGIEGVSPCDVELIRATVHHNTTGGVRLLGGSLRLNNTVVAVNGDGASGPGVSVNFADLDVVYSTIAGNAAFGADSITCEGDIQGTIRNSIELDCFVLDMQYNTIDSANFGSGTNVQTGTYNGAYFSNPGNGDFTISAPPLTPFGGVALWEQGLPPLDADGTPRPDGSFGFAGIDEP